MGDPVSLTIPISVLENNDWKTFSAKMYELGRLTVKEIDPYTWRRAFSKEGISPGGNLNKLAERAEGKAYLLLTFSEPQLKTVPQRITFSGSDTPINFNM